MPKHSLNPKILWAGSASILLAASLLAAEKAGYTDTPQLPNQKWRVHDANRPHPKVVKPGEKFSDLAPAPADAVVLFDGKDLSKWVSKSGGKAGWKVENGYMEINKTGNIRTSDKFGDFQLHIEWMPPEVVVSKDQGRGNSGVIIYGLYEVQVLDSYNNLTYADGQAGAMYGQYPPLVNAMRPPGQWNTYDIIFESPRWDASGKLTKAAKVTVLHNGLVLHHGKEYIGEAVHKKVGNYNAKHPPEGFIELQDHGNPNRYRNIWIRPLGDYDTEKE